MILRKPYAFLIKYFRLINLAIALLCAYLLSKSVNIMRFFQAYVTSNYSGNTYHGFYAKYISPITFLAIILILVGLLVIILLFINKKKPVKLYITAVIYYVLLFILFRVTKGIMISMEKTLLTAEVSRMYRDISIINLAPQSLLIIMIMLRAFGLNINKFNFEKDLKDLKAEEKDNEEVEVTFKSDTVKIKRNARRFVREFKYYVLENKFMVFVIGVIVVIMIASIPYKKLPETKEAIYKQGSSFSVNNLNFTLEDSILTTLDYNGKTIDDNYYLVVRLRIKNDYGEDVKLDFNSFRLDLGKTTIYPIQDNDLYYIDYVYTSNSETIYNNTDRLYLLVFKINEKKIAKSYTVKYRDKFKSGKTSYVNIIVSPVVLNKVTREKEVNVGEKLSLISSNLRNSSIKLSNPIYVQSYMYDYEQCIDNNCNTYKDKIALNYNHLDNTILILESEYTIDEECAFYSTSKNISGFIDKFVSLRYIINEKEINKKGVNITPSRLKGKIALEVPKDMQNADQSFIVITIRNKEYTIRLK